MGGDFLGGVGRETHRFLKAVAGMSQLVFASGVSFFSFREPTRWHECAVQSVRLGVNALPITSLVLLFVGIILGLQMAYVMSLLGGGADIFVPRVISVSIIRELGPLLTAIVMTGRMGAAIAAELGTMVVNEEIMALETSALSPVRFLVVPRLFAAFWMVPALTVFANLVGIFGGGVTCVVLLDMNWQEFTDQAFFGGLVVKDLVTGIIKPFLFGLVLSVISCHAGLSVTGGAEGVGRATTAAVVYSTVCIIGADALSTWVFYYVFKA